MPHKFRCHVCDPAGKSRRSILPSSSHGKAKRKRKKRDLRDPMELYDRLERPHGAWVEEEEKEDEALGQLVRRAIQRWGFPKIVTRLRGPYKSSRFTLLMAAAAAGRVAAVRALLDAEAEASAASSSSSAAAAAKEEVAPLVFACDVEGRTAAHFAVGAVQASGAAVVAMLGRMLEAVKGRGGGRRRLLMQRDKARRNLLHLTAARGGGDENEEDGQAAAAAGEEWEKGEGEGEVMRFLVQALGASDAAALASQDSRTGGAPLAVACAQGGEAECLALLDVTPRAVVLAAEAEAEGGQGEGTPALMEAVGRGLRAVARCVPLCVWLVGDGRG